MSALATEISSDATSGFAQNLRQKVGIAATFEDTGGFAPKLRHAVPAAPRVSKGDVVVVWIGKQTSQHPHTDFDVTPEVSFRPPSWFGRSSPALPNRSVTEVSFTPPSWFGPVLDSMTKRWGVGQGWDTYDAKPTNTQYAVQLLDYLLTIMLEDDTPPVITPLSDGGLQAEWHHNNRDFEIVVSAEEPAKYYYFNAETGEEEEQELDKQDLTYVRRFITNF